MSQTVTENQSAAAGTTTMVEHWIDGASVAGSSDRTGPVYNPALGVEQKRVRFASTEDVDAAVQAAARAFPAWRLAIDVSRQPGNAPAAACTAASTSSVEAKRTRFCSTPSAGL